MIKILFVCHGNICRSPMAESVLIDMIMKEGLTDRVKVASCATSREEIGNPVHVGTKRKLKEKGIPCIEHYAIQLTKADYDQYDYIIGMDERNIINMKRICGEDKHQKLYRLLSFANIDKDIADPWYTGNFDETYNDIVSGCQALLTFITSHN